MELGVTMAADANVMTLFFTEEREQCTVLTIGLFRKEYNAMEWHKLIQRREENGRKGRKWKGGKENLP